MINHQLLATVWNFCYVLRDDGVSCVDYIEQLTLLIFMKIMDENSRLSNKRKINLPKELAWQSLMTKQGEALHRHYNKVLGQLGALPGMVGQIFEKTQNKIQDPRKLEKLIQLINRETWSTPSYDLNGNLYEHLIERMAKDTRKGAGQYFTPRPLVKVIVDCIRPLPNKTIHDPACGTGGFLLGSHDFLIKNHFSKKPNKASLLKIFSGNEIVSSTRRLCLMNLLLQGIGSVYQKQVYIKAENALLDSHKKYDYVFANPPFGKASSIKVRNKKGNLCLERVRSKSDLWATTSNKILNFLQHIKMILKPTGSAAVIVPDSILFEGGASEVIRLNLLKTTNLHTILRLPTGIFSAEAVKTHVLFFDNKPRSKIPWTEVVWFYDYRTNIQHSFRKNPLQSDCLAEFVSCYHAKNRDQCKAAWSIQNPFGRWKKINYAEIMTRDKCNLDLVWLKDNARIDPDSLPHPTKIVENLVDELSKTLKKFSLIQKILMKIP
jgi:type I restriction enzyme M protein